MHVLPALLLLGIVHSLSAAIIGLASNATVEQSSSTNRKCYVTRNDGAEEIVCPSGYSRCITMRGSHPFLRGKIYVYQGCWSDEAEMKCDSATLLAAMKSEGTLDWVSELALWIEPTCCAGDLCNHAVLAAYIGLPSDTQHPQQEVPSVNRKCYSTRNGGEDEIVCPSGKPRCITMRGSEPFSTTEYFYRDCWPDETAMKCDHATVLEALELLGFFDWARKMALWSEPTCCTGDLCNKGLSASTIEPASSTMAPLFSNSKDPQSASVSRKCYGTEDGGEEEIDCPSGITRCITMRGTKPVVRGTTYLTYKSCWPDEASTKCDSATLLAAMERAGKLDWESRSALWSEPTCCTGDLCNDSSGPYDVWVAVGIVGIALYIIIKIVECFRKKELAMAYRRFA